MLHIAFGYVLVARLGPSRGSNKKRNSSDQRLGGNFRDEERSIRPKQTIMLRKRLTNSRGGSHVYIVNISTLKLSLAHTVFSTILT
jgi:hypothetical protein